jgi:hypothetical protein
MRFQLTATPKATAGMDIENITVVFSAPTWDDAAVWADVFMRHVGDASKFSTEIVYARETPEAVVRLNAYRNGRKLERGDGLQSRTLGSSLKHFAYVGKQGDTYMIATQEPGENCRLWNVDAFPGVTIR